MRNAPSLALTAVLLVSASALAQTRPYAPAPLDPTRSLTQPVLESTLHQPLPEEYIWTARSAVATDRVDYSRPGPQQRIEPHFFRAHFNAGTAAPAEATLYLAGPRSVRVWLNGKLATRVEADLNNPLGMHVFAIALRGLLRSGANTLAIEAVRGRGVSGFANSALVRQQTFGEVLVAKIIPAGRGELPPGVVPLLLSNGEWRSTASGAAGFEKPEFDDSAWPWFKASAASKAPLSSFSGTPTPDCTTGPVTMASRPSSHTRR